METTLTCECPEETDCIDEGSANCQSSVGVKATQTKSAHTYYVDKKNSDRDLSVWNQKTATKKGHKMESARIEPAQPAADERRLKYLVTTFHSSTVLIYETPCSPFGLILGRAAQRRRSLSPDTTPFITSVNQY